MITKEIEIDGQKYRLTKLSALNQLPVLKDVLPLIHKAMKVFMAGNKIEKKEGEEIVIADVLSSPFITNMVEELQSLDSAVLERIVKTFLAKTESIGAVTLPLLNDKGDIYNDNIEVDTVLLLVKEHILLNFEKYLKWLQ